MAVLRSEEIVDDWSTFINGAGGKAEDVFTAAKDLIAETKVLNVAVERKEMSRGVVRGVFGTKRDFLVVTEWSPSWVTQDWTRSRLAVKMSAQAASRVTV